MSRRVYLLGVGLALLALTLGLTDWAVRERLGVTRRNLMRIRPGMTLQQVQWLLGGPGVKSSPNAYQSLKAIFIKGHAYHLWWHGSTHSIGVHFSPEGRLKSASMGPRSIRQPALIERFHAWLGW